ncbi:YncE family protein [uncultured Fibrella sp.]|uniref:YncE family protein n=1 Tax=uncultured Fibrella sp. TaxID=1284596 RepID=UPI0035CBA202
MKNRLKTAATYLLATAITGALFTACSKNTDPTPAGPYTNGVIVMNSGNFLQNNGSLSWINRTSTTAAIDIFRARNNRPTSGLVQEYVEAGNRGVILVDNSSAGLDKVEIVTADSLRSVKTLGAPDIENPRHAARVSDTKVYVTCWGTTGSGANFYGTAGYVAVIDLTTNSVLKRIPVNKGAEGVTVVGNEAFVASTAYSDAKTITVIDTQTDAVKQQIAVPTDVVNLVADANNKLWTLSGRNALRINPATKSIEATIPIGTADNANTPTPDKLIASADRRTLYYTYTVSNASFLPDGQLYRFNISDVTITPTTPVINRTFVGFTGVGFDPQSNVIYVGTTPSLAQAGYVYRYQLTGQLVDSVRVEISPVGFYFK